MDQTTDTIVTFADELTESVLQPGTIFEARRRLVDSLACLVGGVDAIPTRIARTLADEVTGGEPATVVGSHRGSSAEMAAFTNTVALRYLDYNDTYFSPRGGGGHPSDLIAGCLAVGETTGASGNDVLLAMITAYEVWGRLAGTVRIRERGWDQGLFTVVASAVAAGRLLGLDREQMAHAISLAVIPNIPTRRTRAGALSMWKGCATAGSARNGIFAARLAALGMTGPPAPFEGPEGIWDQVTGPFQLHLDIPAPGDNWVIESSHLKSRPAEYNGQGPLDIILDNRDRLPAHRIKQIEVDTYWLCWSEIGHESAKWDPQNRETADHSLPYLIAVALADGRVDLDSFTPERVADPTLRPLMNAVTITERKDLTDVFPREIGCRMAVTLDDGSTVQLEVKHPRGHAANPLSDIEINAKFSELTQNDGHNAEVAERIRDAAWAVDGLARIGELTGLLAQVRSSTEVGAGL